MATSPVRGPAIIITDMADNQRPIGAIEGRMSRKLNNALTMTFRNGPDEPIGKALQSGADGVGGKLGVLFGFKNGGPGVHVYTPTVGQALHVQSRDLKPTLLTRDDGSAVGSIERGPTCVGRDANGRELMRWIDHPDGPDTFEAFRLAVTDADGELLAHLNVIRTLAGWSLGRELLEDAIWFGHAGQPLKFPFLGTSVQLFRVLTPSQLEFVIASCIDAAIGLRPYGTGMS